MSIHISQWNQSCAFIWAAQVRIRLADLPPKLPPKGVGTGQHDAALLCTHGTKYVLSLGTKYHKTQQNNTVTHKLWISHNPEVAGSSPVPATKSVTVVDTISTTVTFYLLPFGVCIWNEIRNIPNIFSHKQILCPELLQPWAEKTGLGTTEIVIRIETINYYFLYI